MRPFHVLAGGTFFLFRAHDVIVHPGYFFGTEFERVAVISLLVPEERLREGMARVARAVG